MKNLQFLASALKKLGYNPTTPLAPPNAIPEISAPTATGLLLQELFPESYPAIMQQVYAEGSQATPSNNAVVFSAPSDVSAVLGIACFSQTISDQNTATWLQQVAVDVQIQQSKILSKIPLEWFYRPRQQGLNLPFVPIGRAIKVGDNITIFPSSGTSAVNLIWVLFYNKSAATLI